MTCEEIIEVLEEIALLLELKGENPFKTQAYRNGADIVRQHEGDFLQKAQDNTLSDIKGIGDALAKKIHELVDTGRMTYHQDLKREFPTTIFELFDISGLGPKKIKALHQDLNVASIANLKRVCESGEATTLGGFGKKTCEKILQAIDFHEQHAGQFLLGDAMPTVRAILDQLRNHPAVHEVEVAGSVRRGKEVVHDLDFIVSTSDPEAVMDHFVHQEGVQTIQAHGATKSSILLENGLPCDLRAVTQEDFPFALNYFTGSKDHNVAIRGRARDRGYTLNEYRLAPIEGRKAAPLKDPIRTESDLYEVLDLDYIEPHLRENMGEIEAAEEGQLPQLVALENLRGTFHNHTTASDGRNTLAEMTAAAEDLGLEYLGIADHSKSSFQANGLDADRLLQQVDEIRLYNEKGHSELTLFSGTECDILKDGTLDFEDAVLERLDYVVASIHNVFTLSEKEQTRRLIKAIEHPQVTMIGHLSGRLLLRRKPYAVDVSKILKACAETGTWIEINANPYRLDMDWRWWHRARDLGVKAVINPDAHRVEGLQHLFYGIQVARKGWLRSQDVINCLSLEDAREALSAKSSRS